MVNQTQENKERREPHIQVGILHAKEVEFEFNGLYVCGDRQITGRQKATLLPDGKIQWAGQVFEEVFFEPLSEDCALTLYHVTIGIGFHWEREETQVFKGALRLIVEDGKIAAVNVLPVEWYLTSVISSEMSADAGEEYLKAHAVISRSWVISQMQAREEHAESVETDTSYKASAVEKDGVVFINRWYGRSAHTRFDVCADDHCQRYQGITRETNPAVEAAIKATRGEVLTYQGAICDARFSKSCGGVSEAYDACWDDKSVPYLQPVRCAAEGGDLPDLRCEEVAERWIRSSPEAFCASKDRRVLSKVLNDYDQETPDFYRWKVRLSQEEIRKLIMEKQGQDVGDVLDLVPLERGGSGRIVRLKIQGTKKTLVIGKELEIRRTLSPSHLLSSAFVVDKEIPKGGTVPEVFVLTGAGWGHGVGFCQIGGAVMADKGYPYKEILLHYFKGAELERWYR